MTDDPTTKPCECHCHMRVVAPVPPPIHGFRDEWGVWQEQACPSCHGTGRMPLTTAELLSALHGCGKYWWLSPGGHNRKWVLSQEDPEDDDNCIDWIVSEDLDDALRAALRETHNYPHKPTGPDPRLENPGKRGL